MNLISRLKAIEEKRGARGDGHPTVMRLLLRSQKHVFDLSGILPADHWEPLDPGPPDSLRRQAFDLALVHDETRIWPAAAAGLREALEDLLGRGPLSSEELAAQETEFFHPLTSEEFCQAELRRTIVEAAAAAGEPCPAWLDIAEGDLSPEQLAEIESWVKGHLAAPEVDGNAQQTIPGPIPADG